MQFYCHHDVSGRNTNSHIRILANFRKKNNHENFVELTVFTQQAHLFWCLFWILMLFEIKLTHLSFLRLGQIFNNELFGAVAAEKEVKGIVSKLMEARHSKSMDSYELLARFCSKESITKLILPMKEVREEGGYDLDDLL